jgi:hypothetical protein
VTTLTHLETPDKSDSLYAAQDPVSAAELRYRPLFTGDVLRLGDGALHVLIQHPCSMRRGNTLNPNLLCAQVEATRQKYRSDWADAPFDLCYLPGMSTGAYPAVDFRGIGTVGADAALKAERMAIMSLYGVTLLMQRWIHFTARLVVPTRTLANVFAGPYDEADLIEEVVGDLTARGWAPATALATADEWLSSAGPARGLSRRLRLADPCQRGAVRRELRQLVRDEGEAGTDSPTEDFPAPLDRLAD